MFIGMNTLFNKNPLFLAFLFPALVDGIVTLLGQDAQYWQNYRTVNEASPAYFFLITHPMLYIFGGVLWFSLLYLLVRRLHEPWNLVLTVTLIAGHAWGSSSWLIKMMREQGIFLPSDRISLLQGWTLLVVYFVLIGAFASYALRQYMELRKR